MNKIRIILTICGIVVISLIILTTCIRITNIDKKYEIKPYATYTRLLYVATRCDMYKEHYGTWPDSLAQLRIFRPELNSWAKDAWGPGENMWGSDFLLVPYKESLGYGEIISYGRDGKPGGTGADSDLVVRYPSEINAAWNKQAGLGLKRPQGAPQDAP